MSRHAADRLTARVRAWWKTWQQIPQASRNANNKILADLGRPPLKTRRERRAERRQAREDEEVSWLDVLGTPEDFKQDICGPVKLPGQRHHGPHARPGDIPDQPTGGAG